MPVSVVKTGADNGRRAHRNGQSTSRLRPPAGLRFEGAAIGIQAPDYYTNHAYKSMLSVHRISYRPRGGGPSGQKKAS